MNVHFLVGSVRAGSFNAQLAEHTARLLPEGVTATFETDLAALPFYDEQADAAGAPEVVAAFRRRVAAADALVVATPEYNGSTSALLKNAFDWASRPRGEASLGGKPVGVIGASAAPRAALWAREHVVRIATVAGGQPIERTVGIGSAYETLAAGVPADTEAQLLALVGELTGARLAA